MLTACLRTWLACLVMELVLVMCFASTNRLLAVAEEEFATTAEEYGLLTAKQTASRALRWHGVARSTPAARDELGSDSPLEATRRGLGALAERAGLLMFVVSMRLWRWSQPLLPFLACMAAV